MSALEAVIVFIGEADAREVEEHDMQLNKALIHQRVDEMIERTASELGVPREVVAREVFYRMQRHPNPDLRRNPTAAEKRTAFYHWGGCQRPGCQDPLDFKEAIFHHRGRGVPYQHAPANLLPYHNRCHDAEHSVREGSLSKGTPKRRE